FDCKNESCRAELEGAPRILDSLCAGCREHFAGVRSYLDACGIAYTIEPRLVRGLDYYVRTAFELQAEGLGAQHALMGGGRYDGLVRELGGRNVPGFGWAMGLERLILLLPDAGEARPRIDVLVAPIDPASRIPAALAARTL